LLATSDREMVVVDTQTLIQSPVGVLARGVTVRTRFAAVAIALGVCRR
jgi:hypothetical protein